MATNISPSTATVISSLPFEETTDPVDGATSPVIPSCGSELFGLWWVYTPPEGITGIGIAIESTTDPSEYQPALSVWTGTLPASLTERDNCCYTFKDPTHVRIGVTPGTANYFLVALGGGSGPVGSANLTIGVSTLTTNAPTGSPLITSDIGNQATIVIDATDGTSLRCLGIAASEQGDFLTSGELAVMAEDPADALTAVGIELWAADLTTRITTVTSIIRANQLSLSPIRHVGTTWYVCSALTAAAAQIKTLNAAGTVGGTTWTLPANSANMCAMAVNAAGTILYYANSTNNTPIYAYNLAVPGALPDLVAAPGANFRWQRDLWVIANGDVFAVQRDTTAGTAFNVKHYNSSGVLQFTYPISGTAQSNPRMGFSADETTFVVMSFPSSGVSRFETFTVGNTTATSTVNVDQNENIGEGPLFGPSQSCPLLLTPFSVTPPPGDGTVRVIRRVRRFLLPSSDRNYRMTIPRLEALFQPGVGDGDPDSQGYNPVAMLRVSKDGGKTYSPEQTAEIGKQGEYTKRAIWNRTPNQYRNAVVEIVVTDPVDVALVDVVAPSITEGTS